MNEAKKKAEELFLDFYTIELKDGTHLDKDAAIQCALICVDEIMNEWHESTDSPESRGREKYWQRVKQELNNLTK